MMLQLKKQMKEIEAFKNCAPFTNFISEITNTQIDSAKDIEIVMLMYNLIEYSDNYSKTSGSFWKYYRDEPNNNLIDSFKSKIKITGKLLLLVIKKMLK